MVRLHPTASQMRSTMLSPNPSPSSASAPEACCRDPGPCPASKPRPSSDTISAPSHQSMPTRAPPLWRIALRRRFVSTIHSASRSPTPVAASGTRVAMVMEPACASGSEVHHHLADQFPQRDRLACLARAAARHAQQPGGQHRDLGQAGAQLLGLGSLTLVEIAGAKQLQRAAGAHQRRAQLVAGCSRERALARQCRVEPAALFVERRRQVGRFGVPRELAQLAALPSPRLAAHRQRQALEVAGEAARQAIAGGESPQHDRRNRDRQHGDHVALPAFVVGDVIDEIEPPPGVLRHHDVILQIGVGTELPWLPAACGRCRRKAGSADSSPSRAT